MKVKVKVPASSANLGPGFDVFGLALELFNEFTVETSDNFKINIDGLNGLSKTKENLFYKSFSYLFKLSGIRIPEVKISMKIGFPQGRGLGSSATAVVGGLLSANMFIQNKYSIEELVPMAVSLEHGKHPDNVTPALFGGLIVVANSSGKINFIKLHFPSDLKAIFFIPEFTMDTVTGRKLMPKNYKREDVVFNSGRTALLLAAFQSKKYELLKIAMEDRVHQPTRTKIFPLMPKLIESAIQEGAYGAALSGGGSSIIAFADKNFNKIADGMKKEAIKGNIKGETKILEINNSGSEARLIEL